ncbi:DUF397 domain-containing protein [Saccharopolyspora rhizosphaerae]|uniref:DUF397 domain-containing protein n=2 Tax=Saccharopolyspora rhizosphaerae TaxID=2492662 RepID=A0A3R8PB76_9PSEU|nr:DUF397 domain-containing protein [Saccharopolyspora rhizosphaerae]
MSNWRTSSFSQGAENCVEVGRTSDAGAAVRDTKDRAGGHFTATAPQWQNFIAALKTGRFDR